MNEFYRSFLLRLPAPQGEAGRPTDYPYCYRADNMLLLRLLLLAHLLSEPLDLLALSWLAELSLLIFPFLYGVKAYLFYIPLTNESLMGLCLQAEPGLLILEVLFKFSPGPVLELKLLFIIPWVLPPKLNLKFFLGVKPVLNPCRWSVCSSSLPSGVGNASSKSAGFYLKCSSISFH
jgi:hypothetical protein